MRVSFKTFIDITVIAFTALLIFLPRLSTLPFHWEEPRRVLCAYEMLHSGNWFVPTIQNQVFLSRPPLQNWIIALTGIVRGSFDHLTGRLPSVICALLLAILMYYYCLSLLSRGVALLAPLFFLTMPEIIQFSRTAETELTFTLFLTGSLIFWHWGETKKWPSYLKWSLAYILLACATLTKGINQAPVYFSAVVGVHLIRHRRLNTLLSAEHLFGFAFFCILVGFWQLGFTYYVGKKIGWYMHFKDVGLRFQHFEMIDYLKHAFVFPCELLLETLPWVLFLSAYASRFFWLKLIPPEAKPIAVFYLISIATTIFSVWFPPGAHVRYYMPMFPFFAILAAIAVQSIYDSISSHQIKSLWQQCYPFFITFGIIGIPLVGLIPFICSLFNIHLFASIPLFHSLLYLIGSFILAFGLTLIYHWKIPTQLYLSVICYALFASLTFNIIYMDIQQERYIDRYIHANHFLSKLQELPSGAKLASTSAIEHYFLYYYLLHTGETIPIIANKGLIPKLEKSTWVLINPDGSIEKSG